MKKYLLFLIIIVASLMAACQKPEDEAGDDVVVTADTTEPVVKKCLVMEYCAGYVDKPERVIEWNDDFTRITHVTTRQNTPWQLDFDFEYYGNDSMRVVLSRPDYSWALVYFSDYTCHFDTQGRVSSIDYYVYSDYKYTEKYHYDDWGKLVGVEDEEHHCGFRFVWDGENVSDRIDIYEGDTVYHYDGFVPQIHPYSTLPYLLRSGDSYGFEYLTNPLWRNWYNHASNMGYEYDEDNYVTCSYHIDEQGDKIGYRYFQYAMYHEK